MNCEPPHVWFIIGNNFQLPKQYTNLNTMESFNHYITQEGDTFYLLEINKL